MTKPNTDISTCKGCKKGISMCYHRPCLGTPAEFKKIIEAGFAHKLRIDYWVGHGDVPKLTEKDYDEAPETLKPIFRMILDRADNYENPYKEDVYFLTGGTEQDTNFRSSFLPTGKCKFLTEDNLCELHNLGLKPEQGRESCCKGDSAKENLHYAELWDTPEGKEVLQLFKETVGIQ